MGEDKKVPVVDATQGAGAARSRGTAGPADDAAAMRELVEDLMDRVISAEERVSKLEEWARTVSPR